MPDPGLLPDYVLDGHALDSWLAEQTLALCRIPSVTGDEAAISDYLEQRCAALSPRLAIERCGNAVLARTVPAAGSPPKPLVALFGHSDTVKPSRDQRIEIDAAKGRVYGCGASDMKGGLAVMLRLLADAEKLGKELLCVFYDKEEGPASQSGMVPLCEGGAERLRGIDVALCLEPTDNLIHAGCVGGLQVEVTAHGRRAHSARPWQGQNAIYAALPLLTRLAALGRREVVVDGLRFYEVLTATQARTENSRNVVPDRFLLNLNYRFAPGKTPQVAEAELRAQQGAPTWAYQLDWRSPLDGGTWGACHTLDIGLVFGNLGARDALTGSGPEAQRLSTLMQDTFIAFARHGRPGWAPYSMARRETMVFDLPPTLQHDPRGAERELFAKVPYLQRGTF